MKFCIMCKQIRLLIKFIKKKKALELVDIMHAFHVELGCNVCDSINENNIRCVTI